MLEAMAASKQCVHLRSAVLPLVHAASLLVFVVALLLVRIELNIQNNLAPVSATGATHSWLSFCCPLSSLLLPCVAVCWWLAAANEQLVEANLTASELSLMIPPIESSQKVWRVLQVLAHCHLVLSGGHAAGGNSGDAVQGGLVVGTSLTGVAPSSLSSTITSSSSPPTPQVAGLDEQQANQNSQAITDFLELRCHDRGTNWKQVLHDLEQAYKENRQFQIVEAEKAANR